jgi:hypothetical protein
MEERTVALKRFVTLAGFVFVGVITTCAVFLLSLFGRSGFSFLLASAIAPLVGGGITGYLCSERITTKRGFVYITPGVYLVLAEAVLFVCSADQMSQGIPEVMGVFGLVIFLLSWAGVGTGHYIRREILKDRRNAQRNESDDANRSLD